jgi:hypothetical protein
MKIPKSAATLAAALLLAACSGDGPSPPPAPGDLDGTFVSPNGREGAVLMQVSGTPVRGAAVPGGYAFVEEGDPARVLLVFGETATASFTLTVDDVNRRPNVTLVEVVDNANRPRTALSGYRVELDR